jgi:hypothetical protein
MCGKIRLMTLIKRKKRQRAQDEWTFEANPTNDKVVANAPSRQAYQADMKQEAEAVWEEFLSRQTAGSRALLVFIRQWFNVGRPSSEGRGNPSSILYALKNEWDVRDEFLDAVDLVCKDEHSVGWSPLVTKYVMHTRAAEIRGALAGIEHGWDVVKFAKRLEADQSRTRKIIVYYVHRQKILRGEKAKLKDIDICRHLDGIQLRIWERRARNPETLEIISETKEKLRFPMPKGWLEVIKTDEDESGPWIGALNHAELHGRVEKFLSEERRIATSAAANLYWAWWELAKQAEHICIEDIAAEMERNRDPRDPNGALLENVVRRIVKVPENI